MTPVPQIDTRDDGLAICEECGQAFIPYSRAAERQRFCAPKCRTRYWDRQHPRVRLPRAARRTDPASSADAVTEHTLSGSRHRHIAIVFALLEAAPGSTARELAEHAPEGFGISPYHEVMRRLNDLCKTGRAVKGARRPCRITRKRVLTWFPRYR